MSPKEHSPEAYHIGEQAGSTVRGAVETAGRIAKGVGSLVAVATVAVLDGTSNILYRNEDMRNPELRDKEY